MQSAPLLTPSTLSVNDHPWRLDWDIHACTLCGRCTAVCPVSAIELGVFRKRSLETTPALAKKPTSSFSIYYGIRQRTDPAYRCIGCAMCNMVCPNNAIAPRLEPEATTLKFHNNRGGAARTRGGRRNDTGSLLDQIKFIRISMLTDPALDAGRHEFELRTLLGRVQPPEDGLAALASQSWVPPVREIYPLMIGSMSFGALSPNMWEGLVMGVTYLNEEMGMPVRMCTGEGGCPPRLLRSRFLKYMILQIASGYFGWDEIIKAIPEMKEDPCAIEIKYGQGAKPGDGGLLMWYKVNKLIAAIRGVPAGVSLPSPPHPSDPVLHRGVRGQDDPVHVHGLGIPRAGLSQDLRHHHLHLGAQQPRAQPLRGRARHRRRGRRHRRRLQRVHEPHGPSHRQQPARLLPGLVTAGKQNEIPLIAGGGIGKNGNLAANAAALIMLGASAVQSGKYMMQAAAGCVGSEHDRCNVCNIGVCPKGITSQDPRVYRRLDPEKVAERLVDVFLAFDTELRKIVAPLGRSTSLPTGMSDALGIGDYHAAERLKIKYVV